MSMCVCVPVCVSFIGVYVYVCVFFVGMCMPLKLRIEINAIERRANTMSAFSCIDRDVFQYSILVCFHLMFFCLFVSVRQ